MFAKLLFIILIAGATAAALLVNRQHRIETAHEIAATHQRLAEQDRLLWRLRSDVAEHVQPERIRHWKMQMNQSWVAIPEPPSPAGAPSMRLAGPREATPADDGDSHGG